MDFYLLPFLISVAMVIGAVIAAVSISRRRAREVIPKVQHLMGIAIPATRAQLLSLFSREVDTLSDADLDFRSGVLNRLAFTGVPFCVSWVEELGPDYLCSLADGSIVAWGRERIVRGRTVRDIELFDASLSSKAEFDASVEAATLRFNRTIGRAMQRFGKAYQ